MKHFKIFFFLLLVTAACGSTDDSTESDGLTESELELRNESGDELNPDDKAAVEKWAADNNLSAERTESLLETFTVVAELYRSSAGLEDAADRERAYVSILREATAALSNLAPGAEVLIDLVRPTTESL